VPAETRALVILQLEELLGSEDARTRVNAARALLAAGGLNLQQAQLALQLVKFESERELEQRVKVLEELRGVTGRPGGSPGEREAGGSDRPAPADPVS
jgi:hypothetical protein